MVFIQKETNMLNPNLKEGDRILLIHMDGETSVSIGEKGTVKRNSRDPFEKDDTIYSVEWDNGTTLNLLSATDSWIYDKDFKPKGQIKESKYVKNKTCNQFTTGGKFCSTLTELLKNKSNVKKMAINFFDELISNVDLTGVGQKIKLEPGNPHFDKRYEELLKFYNILKDSGQCQKMSLAIEKDLESVKEKGLVMVVDNDDKYSLFNRLNTHYTNQAVILTKAFLKTNSGWGGISEIDSFSPELVKSNIIDYLEITPENLSFMDSVITDILNDEQSISNLMSNFDYSKGVGDIVESEVAKAFIEKGYEVFEFGADFGFVDHFGVDMVVMKNGIIHPVQASSIRKSSPKFFEFNEPNCKCWSVYPYGKSYRVETLMEGKEIKEGSVEEMDEYMKLKDIFKSGKKKKIFDFFESIRTSGIVNMFESSRFIYSGGEYIKDYVKMQKYSGYEFDEDTIDNLADLADDAKNEMIRITMEVLESKNIEPTLDNMNREIKRMSNEALRFFIMLKSV
tara:strand:- start:15 stop:1541 length:1527 start_codon:yes stop_codon:yes gene_type:complete